MENPLRKRLKVSDWNDWEKLEAKLNLLSAELPMLGLIQADTNGLLLMLVQQLELFFVEKGVKFQIHTQFSNQVLRQVFDANDVAHLILTEDLSKAQLHFLNTQRDSFLRHNA
nr:hypothetical protein [Spirosomataceae bacterium]